MRWTRRFPRTPVFLALAAVLTASVALRFEPAFGGDKTERQKHVAANGIPAPYQSLKRPAASANTASGKSLYKAQCARCHGSGAKGDGEDGAYNDPPPSDLVAVITTGKASDAYLYWSIADGSEPIGKVGMEVYKETLKPAQIWAIIDHLRALAGKK